MFDNRRRDVSRSLCNDSTRSTLSYPHDIDSFCSRSAHIMHELVNAVGKGPGASVVVDVNYHKELLGRDMRVLAGTLQEFL